GQGDWLRKAGRFWAAEAPIGQATSVGVPPGKGVAVELLPKNRVPPQVVYPLTVLPCGPGMAPLKPPSLLAKSPASQTQPRFVVGSSIELVQDTPLPNLQVEAPSTVPQAALTTQPRHH